jgi:hypothetical protein
MTTKELEAIEIYPKIFVYKNLFKDIEKIYKNLKESNGSEDGLFSPWTPWAHFGEYINPILKNPGLSINSVEDIKTTTGKQEDHKVLLLELFENFYRATQDYVLKNNVDFDIEKTVLTKNGEEVKEWQMTGPSIARYKTDIDHPVAMTYHSDYIREPILSPGYKFAITCLVYFNDDYEGGEIDFITNGEAYMYKPEAGDILIFPSGHPDMLMGENSIYIHGVMVAKGPSKYLSRMYWTKYSVGDDEWFEKEKEFGKEVWDEMQEEIIGKFRYENPNRSDSQGVKRIK